GWRGGNAHYACCAARRPDRVDVLAGPWPGLGLGGQGCLRQARRPPPTRGAIGAPATSPTSAMAVTPRQAEEARAKTHPGRRAVAPVPTGPTALRGAGNRRRARPAAP